MFDIKKTLTFLIIITFVSLINVEAAKARPVPESFADLVEKLLPTVVNISTSQTVESSIGGFPTIPEEMFPPGHPFERFGELFNQFNNQGGDNGVRKEKLTSLGSGFIISDDGLVVTNYHVIANSEEITVTLHDDSQYTADVIGHDAKTDLAVLRINTGKKKVKFPHAEFGDSSKARVGDWVIAIGNPFNLGGTVTAGIVSARARDINAGPFDNFIQTDAAINRGNSGGPMFNVDGLVVGVNSAIFSPSGGNVGIGFAIPSSMAEPIIDQLKQGKEIQRGWLGVKIQTVTKDIADSLGLEADKGALVVGVVKDSPAEKAGFEKGDVILTFNGEEIATMRKLPRIVAETDVGKKVKVEILRKGDRKTLHVTLGKLEDEEDEIPLSLSKKEDDKRETSAEEFLGMRLIEIDSKVVKRYELADNAEGLLVVQVNPGSDAATKGIRPGDILSEANQKTIKELDDLKDAISDAKDDGKKSILLYLARDGDGIYMALSLED